MEQAPRVFGWVRASKEKQERSPEMQAQDIQKRAEGLVVAGAVWGGIFPRQPENRWYSGKAIPLLETRDGRALAEMLRRDDYLLTWKIDRLGRRNKDILILMDLLVEKGVRTILLDQPGTGEVEYNSSTGRLLLQLQAMFAELEVNQTSERTVAALDFRRRNGMPYHGQHHFGYRRIVQTIPPSTPGEKPKRRIVRLEPCPVEQAIAEELYHRVLVRGETLASVCRDFQRRGLRDSEGKRFTGGANGRSGSDTLRRMLQWAFREKHLETPRRLGVRGMRAYLGREWRQDGSTRSGNVGTANGG